MWNKPWSMKEGFLIGGGLLMVGLALELSVGQVKWDAFAWPVNGYVFGGFLALIAIVFLLRKKVYAFQFLGTYQAAIPAMVYAVTLTIIMGLTRQKVGGTWLNDMLSFWPFVLIYVYITVILGAVTLKRLYQIVNRQSSNRKWFDLPFLLNHLGLFLALTTATLGNADMQRLKMITAVGEPEWRALDANGAVKEMPLAIELKRFIMETYDNGSPKRFASEIQILTKTKKNIETVVDVNKPYEVDGWKIYQYGYDTQRGADSQISILELVSDPWLPLVYTGIFMMLAGTVLLVLYTRWRMKRLLPIGVLLVVALAIVSHLIPVFRSNLVPALQSIKRPLPSYISPLTSSLVYIGLIFMTFGMMFGAFWAKEAWGHYWSWDPKETWAAITWLSYLVYVHYRLLPRHKERLALCMLIISFALLQMCWWGINYLPSAQGSSVHTYQTN